MLQLAVRRAQIDGKFVLQKMFSITTLVCTLEETKHTSISKTVPILTLIYSWNQILVTCPVTKQPITT